MVSLDAATLATVCLKTVLERLRFSELLAKGDKFLV